MTLGYLLAPPHLLLSLAHNDSKQDPRISFSEIFGVSDQGRRYRRSQSRHRPHWDQLRLHLHPPHAYPTCVGFLLLCFSFRLVLYLRAIEASKACDQQNK